jgi:ATP-dependent Clp protease ATP-binding subunit ClpA
MLFHHGKFSPEFCADPRLQAVLAIADQQAGEMLCAADMVCAAAFHADRAVVAILVQSLRPGCALADLAGPIVVAAPRPAGPRPRTAFDPHFLAAVDDFEQVLDQGGPGFAEVTLELLLHLVLARLGADDRHRLAALDVEQAAVLFRAAVEKAVSRPSAPAQAGSAPPLHGTDAGPFPLPPELCPSEDLTHRVRAGGFDGPSPFDGEPRIERLFDAVARALHRSQAGHVLLVGERGVGKHTIITELARRAAAGRPAFLARKRFVRADCRYVVAEETRPLLHAMLAHVAGRPDLVLCVDAFAGLLNSDRPGGNKAVLFAGLARSSCRVIGLMTPREYEEMAADDPEIAEFFARIDVEEPEPELALKIMTHFAAGLQQRYRVAIDEQAVRQAVALTADYVLNDHLPAKALKVLHRACENLDYERGQLGAGQARITAEHILTHVAESSGVPEETLRGVAGRADYERSLSDWVVGQEEAVREVATELGLIKAGMTDPGKPASVLLFLGQTGTGKTELAKALARLYSTSKRLRTYTLGNCVEPHSVSTIIGVPPGYVGHDRGGRLVNELHADPYCVFLLDEADKAHPDVLQPFLNLFDEGYVCDQRGARGHAGKAIFILTSNVGQRMIADMVREGKSREEISTRMKEVLSQIRHPKAERPVFAPEFLARIKRIIVFNSLDRAAMDGICSRQVAELRQNWATRRGKQLEVPDALIEHVGAWGYRLNERAGGKEGGRIVRKLLADWLEARMQRAIAERPEVYRASATVRVEFRVPEGTVEGDVPRAPEVTVRFC